MSSNNRVIWEEGLFLKPHHLQQQTRWTEKLVQDRVLALTHNAYGLQSITFNTELLPLGIIAIQSARGVMQDGTPFDLPASGPLPKPLDLSQKQPINKLIYLCLPQKDDGVPEVDSGDGARFVKQDITVRDNSVGSGQFADVSVAGPQLKLMVEGEDLSTYFKIAIGLVVDKKDSQIVLDQNNFIPTCLDASASDWLTAYTKSLVDQISQRADTIAQRIGSPGQNGVADVQEFLMLLALNRYQPTVTHIANKGDVHPEELYLLLSEMAGELATFGPTKRPAELPKYDHDAPTAVFNLLKQQISAFFSDMIQPNCVALPLIERAHGYMLANLPETGLNGEFVLAVRADITSEQLNKQFPLQFKVATAQSIRNLVTKGLAGVPLVRLAVAPRQLPYHAGFSYFRIDKSAPAWRELIANDPSISSGFGLHLTGDYPGLQLKFWQIKTVGE